MKKIILSVAAVFAFGFANAQEGTESTGNGFANGDVFLTGSVGFSSSKTGDFKASTMDLSPSAAMFVSDNIAIGLRLGYGTEKLDFDGVDVANNTLSVGAFARYYATPASNFSVFGELGFNYKSSDNEFGVFEGELVPADFKTTGFEIALRPGVSYFISNNFALEASIAALSYNTEKPDGDGAESTDTFQFGVNLTNINLGLIYKF